MSSLFSRIVRNRSRKEWIILVTVTIPSSLVLTLNLARGNRRPLRPSRCQVALCRSI